MGFAAVGIFSFGLACVVLLMHPEALSGNPIRGSVLALTHLVTLGWIASLLFVGAYLLGPVLAGSPLWSSKLPVLHLICHVTGLALMLGGLAVLRYQIASMGALILFVGLLMLVVNLMKTANRRSLWSPANLAFQTAMFWLALTGAAALFMLRARLTGNTTVPHEILIAMHAHFALFGFLAQALLAVSLWMVPYLLRTENPPAWLDHPGWTGWTLLNGGLLAIFPAVLTGSRVVILVAGALIALGVVMFVVQLVGLFMLRRERVTWDAVIVGTGILLLVLIVLGALASLPAAAGRSADDLRAWMRLYISLSLLGPFAFAILGSGERIIPRLVWQLRLAPWSGYANIPEPDTLTRTAAGGPVFFSLLMGWGYLAAGQILNDANSIRLGAILLLVAFAWFLVSVSPAILRLVLGVTPGDLSGLRLSHGEPPQPTQTA